MWPGVGIQSALACAGNNIALDASATRRLNSAQQSHSPRKKPKLEPSPSVSQQTPATLEGHTPSGSIHQPAQQEEQQQKRPDEPSRNHDHQNGEQQVSLTSLMEYLQAMRNQVTAPSQERLLLAHKHCTLIKRCQVSAS